MRESIFACPICGEVLVRDEKCCRCRAGHSFDIAKEGYVNLLPANRQHSTNPGDDREMVNARTSFLNGGWYAPLRERLCELARECRAERPVLADAGCGEGYYTEALAEVIAERDGSVAGVDLSKAAVRRAAKRCRNAEIAVASVYHLPIRDEAVDVMLDCFSPLAIKEFHRVLRSGGKFLYVVPGARHLWELKEILYEEPYQNAVKEEAYEGFRQTETVPLEFRFRLESHEAITALFHMTPYTWKTPKDGAARLERISELEVTAAFRILVFERL